MRKRGKFFRHVGGMEVFRRFGKGLETAIFGQFTENEQNILTGHGMIPLCILLKGKDGTGGRRSAGTVGVAFHGRLLFG